MNRFIDNLIATRHCQSRWQERFPDYNFNDELTSTRRCGRKMRKSIRENCITNAWKSHNTAKWIYLISRSKIVFVVDLQGMKIVTVFKYVLKDSVDQFREQCRALMSEGHSISKIAKITGKSYNHTKNICLQEQS